MEFLNQFMRIMRLTIVIITMALMQVSAAGWAQKVSLDLKNVPLEQVLIAVQKQTAYNFVYTEDVIGKAKPINIKVSNAELKDVLDMCFKNQPLNFSIEQKTIVVKEKEASFLNNLIARFQTIDVRGRVVDENGLPLIGASVTVKGSSKNTSTNTNGEFYLSGVDEKAMLVFSFVGYRTLELVAKANLSDVKLEMTSGDLQEVMINRGYYTTKQELNTGSSAIISGEIIRQQPVNNPLSALEGRLTGVYISQSSGITGSQINLSIRGKNSIAAGLDPLYIVDGVPYPSITLSQTTNAAGIGVSPFTNIRPENIESIVVLKDADATAIYGSRGANGVVLITTKQGKSGKAQFNFNVSRGAGKITRRLKLLNTQEYLEMRNEAYKNDNTKPSATQYDINGIWDQNRYTDWQEVMIGGIASLTNVNSSVSGGSENTRFLIGGSYRKETTVFPGDFNNTIAGFNANINHVSADKRFNLNFNSSYSDNVNNLPQADFTSYIFLPPNTPVIYDNQGNINWENNSFRNPLANTLKTARVIAENIITNVTSSYDLFQGIQIKVNAGLTSYNINETNLTPYASLIPSTPDPENNRASQIGVNKMLTWIIEPQININKSFGKHLFDALIASTIQENEQNGNTVTASGFSSDALLETNGAATRVTSTSTYGQYRYTALFARLGYNYASKYVLNLTGRRDGSSRFGPGNQFGTFGAIGVAWIFSKEKFIEKTIPFLSFGKFRGSIGKTGNDQIGDYQFLDTYIAQLGYAGISGILPDKLANPSYRWETLNKLELGSELGFLDDKLMVNTNVFRNRTSNQLVGFSLPSTTGFNTVIANLPAVIENKGLEIDVTSNNIRNGQFKWTTTANVTVARNKLVDFPGIESTSYASQYAVGHSLDMAYRYKYTGVDPKTGYFSVADLDNDGSINSTTDRYPVTNNRMYFGGIGNNLSYKGFNLDLFFQFVKQMGFTNVGSGTQPGRFFAGNGNIPLDFLNRWRNPGEEAQFQKFSASSNTIAFVNYMGSDARITDASFIRLKNVVLSWQFPKILMNKIGINSACIFMQGQNLLTITKFQGMDPENSISSTAALPPLRMVNAGINVSL